MAYPIRPDGAPDADLFAAQLEDNFDAARRVADQILAASTIGFDVVRAFLFHCKNSRDLMDVVGSAGNVANVSRAVAQKIMNRTALTVTAAEVQTAAQSLYTRFGAFVTWAAANYPRDAGGFVLDTQINANGTFTFRQITNAPLTALKAQVTLVRNEFV